MCFAHSIARSAGSARSWLSARSFLDLHRTACRYSNSHSRASYSDSGTANRNSTHYSNYRLHAAYPARPCNSRYCENFFSTSGLRPTIMRVPHRTARRDSKPQPRASKAESGTANRNATQHPKYRPHAAYYLRTFPARIYFPCWTYCDTRMLLIPALQDQLCRWLRSG